MALFTGEGTLILNGSSARIHDVWFSSNPTDGGLELSGGAQSARNVRGPILVTGDFCSLTASVGVNVTWNADEGALSDCVVETFANVTGIGFRAVNNLFRRQEGLSIVGDDAVVEGNTFQGQGLGMTANTQDGVDLDGNRNLVTGNKFRPVSTSTRAAVNVVGGDCNQIVGNDFGDPADYMTAPLIDAGTNTQLYFPNDFTYGDNFTLCDSDSS